jgi:predicted phosphodiesterase
MRYAIISDIHSNLEALTAVIAHIERCGADRIICLGDIVGYHANPNECIELIRQREVLSVAGNHDRAAAGLKEPVDFSQAARCAILWTQGALTEGSRRFLEGLPTFGIVHQKFLIVHAALHPYPNEDLRLRSPVEVVASMESMVEHFPGLKICFVGHMHAAVVYEYRNGSLSSTSPSVARLDPEARYIINPGSVGQPRDGDNRASFAIFDSETATIQFCRVEYDRAASIQKARRVGLIRRSALRAIFSAAIHFPSTIRKIS